MLNDPTAVRIIESVDVDFARMSETISEAVRISWIARCMRFDEIVNRFVRRYPEGSVVKIGCGLDTSFERIDGAPIVWYDLDLPDVIALRRKFIPETERRRFISSSFLDTERLRSIENAGPVLFIAANVFCCFEEKQIHGFLRKPVDSFPYSELFFEVASPIGVRFGKKFLEKAGMSPGSIFTRGLKNTVIGFLSDLSGNYYMIHLKIGES